MLSADADRLAAVPTANVGTNEQNLESKNVLASHSAPYEVVETDLRPALAFAHTDRPHDTRGLANPVRFIRRPRKPHRMCPTNAPWPNVEPSCADCRRSWRPQHTHTQLAQHAAHSHTPKNAVSQRTASDRSCPYVHVRRTRKRRASQSSSSSHITGRARNETVLFAARESGRLPGAGQARAHARADAQTAPPASPHPSETRDHATAMGWG